MNPQPAMNAKVKHPAMILSTRLARCSGTVKTVVSSLCSPRPVSSLTSLPWPSSATSAEPSRRGVGGGVPMTRRGATGPSETSVSSMSLMAAAAPSPSVLDHAAWR